MDPQPSEASRLIQLLSDYAPYSYVIVVASIVFWAFVIHFIFARLKARRTDDFGSEEADQF